MLQSTRRIVSAVLALLGGVLFLAAGASQSSWIAAGAAGSLVAAWAIVFKSG